MEKAATASTTPTATQGAHATRSVAAKAGAARDGDQAAGPADAFALLLAAMGQDAAADASLLDPAPAAVASAADEPMLPTAAVTATAGADPAALLPWMASLQAPALSAQPLQQTAGAAQEVGVSALAGRTGLGLARSGQDSLVGQTAMLDSAAEVAATNGTATDDGAAVPMGRAGAGRAPLRGAVAQGAADPARGTAALRTAGAQAAQAAADQVAAQAVANGPAAGQSAGASGMERGNSLQAAAQLLARAESDPTAPALAAGGMDAGTITTAAGKPGAAPTAEGGVQGLERPAQQGPEGAAPDSVPATPGGADDLLADQLAEQVTYWVHQKTQNAELTLSQGGLPVEVKVALTGEQAHVSLRSDQLEARQLLDAGRDQLQDMLQRQGLQLAGMTVGTSGGDGAGARQDGREPGRQGAQRASVQAAPVGSVGQRGQGAGDRRVDIFV